MSLPINSGNSLDSINSIDLPQFNHIIPREIQPMLENILKENLDLLNQDSLSDPVLFLEKIENRLQLFWSPISHLHAVKNTPELREVYTACVSLLSDYETALSHHPRLYEAFQQFKPKNSDEERIKTLKLRDFRLSGADLSPDKKISHAKTEKKLSLLETKFSENLLDAAQSFEYKATPAELTGIPAHLVPENNLLTLDYPCYSAIQKYAENRQLREMFYQKYVTRASELNEARYDNSEIMREIMILRQSLAQLLGFKNYADLSLQTKMAHSCEEVLNFLNKLLEYAKPKAGEELKVLTDFAKETQLAPWDIAFYSEKLSQQQCQINQEMFRPYFRIEFVLSGLFAVVNKIYGLVIQKSQKPIQTWDKSVECYEIYNSQHQLQGIFYLDLYTRKLKREGAWMDDYCSRYLKPNGKTQIPVAYLTCNFLKPAGEASAFLTHDDVLTLFHEFGHGLQHLLTQINRLDIAGIHGVPWDAVELPSQLMENFCWQKEVLKLISNHTLPDDLIQKLLDARYFQTGLQLVRQLEFGLFDLHLHLEPAENLHTAQDIMRIFNHVHQKTAVIKTPHYYRFPHSFSHIFAGGYSAAYYSYLWAEVLSCDVFGLFEETGIFNPETGLRFLNTFLSRGGSEPPEILFKNFLGRNPDQKAFLKSWGLL